MAYVETKFRANDGSGPMIHYFNVNDAVGPGCANRPDDVALVQVFLQSLGNLPEAPVQGTSWPVNGVWTPNMTRGIRLFQRLARKILRKRNAGESIAVDGVVRPAASIYEEGLRMYTIVALNKAYAHYFWPDYLQKWPMTKTEATMLNGHANHAKRAARPSIPAN